MKLTQKYFNKYLATNYIFESLPRVSVGLSGGPDSMCLLFLLINWVKKNNGILYVLIIDHQLRKNSYLEASFVKKYLNMHKVNSNIIKVNKNNINKKNMNEARKNRFEKMINFCKKNNIFHLFLAHHNDDNIETFLLRKVAGSNLEGLRCMQNKVNIKSLQILRPLLENTKKEIICYNELNDIKFVIDPSNNNEKYSRVVIRNFIKEKNYFKKQIIKDFNNIKINYPFYKKMIFNKLNYMIKNISNKSILVDNKNFFKQEQEIQTKILEIIYKFLFPYRSQLRYKKSLHSLKILNSKDNISVNLAGMLIEKEDFLTKFNA